MTISINAVRGENHKAVRIGQKERWVPDSDDGASFTPGTWVADGAAFEVPAGEAHSQVLEEGQSIKFWAFIGED